MAKDPADDALFEVEGVERVPGAKAPAGKSNVFRHYDPT